MRDIDSIAEALERVMAAEPGFKGIDSRISAFAAAARLETETMRTDPAIFEVWPEFVACGEQIEEFTPSLPGEANDGQRQRAREGLRLLRDGKELVTYLAGARVPMPKSTRHFLARVEEYREDRRALYPD